MPFEHTDGPWQVNKGCSGPFSWYVCNPNGDAECGNWLVARTNWLEDAFLIASAPALFEYVKSSASAGCATAKALVDKIENPPT